MQSCALSWHKGLLLFEFEQPTATQNQQNDALTTSVSTFTQQCVGCWHATGRDVSCHPCHIRMWMGWCGLRSCARKPISFTCAWTIPNLGKSWRPDFSLGRWLTSAVMQCKAYPNKSSSDPWGMLVPAAPKTNKNVWPPDLRMWWWHTQMLGVFQIQAAW